MEKKTIDFTRGSIPRHLIMFSIPMFLGNLLQALYNTVDSIWVGRFLGPQALAAVSVGFPVIFALVALIMGAAMAMTTLVSQYYGAKRQDMVVKTIGNSLITLTVLGLIVSVIGVVYRGELLSLINTPPDIMEQASGYLGVFLSGLIGMFWYNGISAILRGLGDSRTPLKFLAYATVINIVLDPLLIFGLGPLPAMGVKGAALATVIAQGISSLLALRYLFQSSGLVTLNKEFWIIDWSLIGLIFKIGLPAGLQHTLVSLSSLAVGAMVNRFGSTVVAGFGAAARIEQFAFMPAMSISLAVSALVGQNLGAQKEERVKDSVKWSGILAIAINFVVSLAILFIPTLLLAPFTKDTGVLEAGALYLRYLGYAYIPFALMFTLGGVLRGAGDTVTAMLLTLISLWVIRVPLAAYLSVNPYLGVKGIWLAIVISIYTGLIINYLYYRTGRWKKFAVVKGPAFEQEISAEPATEN